MNLKNILLSISLFICANLSGADDSRAVQSGYKFVKVDRQDLKFPRSMLYITGPAQKPGTPKLWGRIGDGDATDVLLEDQPDEFGRSFYSIIGPSSAGVAANYSVGLHDGNCVYDLSKKPIHRINLFSVLPANRGGGFVESIQGRSLVIRTWRKPPLNSRDLYNFIDVVGITNSGNPELKTSIELPSRSASAFITYYQKLDEENDLSAEITWFWDLATKKAAEQNALTIPLAPYLSATQNEVLVPGPYGLTWYDLKGEQVGLVSATEMLAQIPTEFLEQLAHDTQLKQVFLKAAQSAYAKDWNLTAKPKEFDPQNFKDTEKLYLSLRTLQPIHTDDGQETYLVVAVPEFYFETKTNPETSPIFTVQLQEKSINFTFLVQGHKVQLITGAPEQVAKSGVFNSFISLDGTVMFEGDLQVRGQTSTRDMKNLFAYTLVKGDTSGSRISPEGHRQLALAAAAIRTAIKQPAAASTHCAQVIVHDQTDSGTVVSGVNSSVASSQNVDSNCSIV